MKYIGSKRFVLKHILPIMLKERGDRVWVEPFVGGANVICNITGERIGNDTHKYLIALLRAVQEGWIPPTEVSKELYYSVKDNPDIFKDEFVGFVGFLCSFGAKWWGGYAKNKRGENFAGESSRVLVKQAKTLGGVKFTCMNYCDMVIPDNSLIYCDPPYAGTSVLDVDFNHFEFWEWCRNRSREGHIVFVSEYNAPDDFECLLEMDTITNLNKNGRSPRLDKLFKFKG